MKLMKISSIFLLCLFFIGVFIPEASARHHCRSRSSFGLSFNLGAPAYPVAPAPVVAAPAPVYPAYVAPAPVYPYPYYYNPPVIVERSRAPVVVERPRVYVQPGFSYSYWRN